MHWILAAFIALLILTVLGLAVVAVYFFLKSRRNRDKESGRKETTKTTAAANGKKMVTVTLPLPPPKGDNEEISWDPTQHSDLEKLETGTGPSSMRSHRSQSQQKTTDPQSSKEESSKRSEKQTPVSSERSSVEQQQPPSAPPTPLPGFTSKEDPMSALDSSCAQHSYGDVHVLNTPPEERAQRATASTMTPQQSAGFTPRYARKLPPVAKSSSGPPLPSPLNTPTKGVVTAQEMQSDVGGGVRSENLASVVDEDAGRTPIGHSPGRQGGTKTSTTTTSSRTKEEEATRTGTTADLSRLTTYTPTNSTAGGTSRLGQEAK